MKQDKRKITARYETTKGELIWEEAYPFGRRYKVGQELTYNSISYVVQSELLYEDFYKVVLVLNPIPLN